MRNSVRALALSAFFVCTAAAYAGDLSGIWTGQIAGRNGEPQDETFRFTQTGNALTGKLYGESGDVPVVNGTIDGNQVSFQVILTFGSRHAAFHYNGVIDGQEMHLTRERERDPDAGEKRDDDSQKFSLRRMT